MGVPGLWDIIRPAGEQRSLAHLALTDGFLNNHARTRGLRIGIDASIWFYHATYGREGENPELRTLFFRCARLMRRPFLPLFVFDGPKRPNVKRGKRVGDKDHWMISGMQEIIEAFGFEWHRAPGEAEAELAYLNRVGVIDAIVTDDVDTFVFGAKLVIRNNGKLLTGNNGHPVASTAANNDVEHTYTYDAARIASHEEIALSTDGLILIALLRGGDYDTTGLPGCGPNVAHALARCGFGETLMDAARKHSGDMPRLKAFLDSWRGEVRQELKTNARGFLNSKKASLASKIPNTFPDIDVLQLYAKPITSENYASSSSAGKRLPVYRWDKEPDLGKLAALCERKFEWGTREAIVKRFRTVIWEGAVQRILRRAVLCIDEDRPSTPTRRTNLSRPTSPSKRMIARHFSSHPRRSEPDSDSDAMDQDKEHTDQLIVGIKGKRAHASLDGLEEYRLEVNPTQLVRLTRAGIQGIRIGDTNQQSSASSSRQDDEDEEMFALDDEDSDGEGEGGGKRKKGGPKKPPPDPDSVMRMWMPVCMVELVEPGLVAHFEGEAERKKATKERKEAKKAAGETRSRTKAPTSSSSAKGAKKVTSLRRIVQEEEEEEEMEAEEDFSDVFGLKPKPKPPGKSKSKQRMIFEESDDDTGQSPSPPKSPSKPRARPKTKDKPSNAQGRIDNFMQASKSSFKSRPPAAGPSSTISNPAMGKKPSLLEALDSQSSASSSRAPSKSKVEPSRESKAAPMPFPMPVFNPLERARQRNVVSSASTSVLNASSKSFPVTIASTFAASSTPLTAVVSSSSTASDSATTVTRKANEHADVLRNGNKLSAREFPMDSGEESGSDEMPTTLSGIARTSQPKPKPAKPRKSVIEIFSSDSDSDSDSNLNNHTPPTRARPLPPSPTNQTRTRTHFPDDTIILTSSPVPITFLPSPSHSQVQKTQTGRQTPSLSPTRQTRIDTAFRVSKAPTHAHARVGAVGKPTKTMHGFVHRPIEFAEEDVIEIEYEGD